MQGLGDIMIEKEELRILARKLMFEMNDEEYNTLQKEFEVILKQMDLISKIDNISAIEPMTYPFELTSVSLREDVVDNLLTSEDILLNVKSSDKNQVKVPKVVE